MCVRLLLDINDVSLNWKKITRVLPRARRYALDRIPTVEEIREIVDAAYIRERRLLHLFGIREGAIVNLRVGDYSTIECDKEKPAAGRLVVYSGEIYCFHKSRGMSCIR